MGKLDNNILYQFKIIIHNILLKSKIFSFDYDIIKHPAFGVRLFNFPVFVLRCKKLPISKRLFILLGKTPITEENVTKGGGT